MSEVEKLVERLKAVLPKMIGTLPVCPFDRRSPDYWTTANDKPCHACGGTEEVDKCRGADLRCMDEASDAMREAASTLQSQARRVEELEGALRIEKERASVLLEAAYEAVAELGDTDSTATRFLIPAILKSDGDPEYARQQFPRSVLSEGSGSSRGEEEA